MKEINVGIVGFGFMGKAHTYGYKTIPLYYSNLPFKIRLVGICDAMPGVAEQAKEQLGFEFATTNPDDIFNNPEINCVDICTPNIYHKEGILNALKAGKNVYCDKPLSASYEESQEILEVLKGSSSITQVALQYRCFPGTMRAKELIDEGKLGKIIPTSLATFIIYFIIGIWHGANWRYVAFGFWNGTIITVSLLLAPQFLRWKEALHINDQSKGWHLFQLVRTNILVFFGRYITRAPRFLTAVWMVKETFLHPNLPDLYNGTLLTLGLAGSDFAILFCGVVTMLAVEWYQEKRGHIRPMLERRSPLVQWLAILLPLVVLFCFGMLRADYISSDFIYKQF